MLKLWLPPKVWFHGSQSTITGGWSVRKVQAAAALSWLAHIMRWVLITPLGWPVEPEVKRILATVSGPTRANARVDGRRRPHLRQRRERRQPRSAEAARLATISSRVAPIVSSALA